jgi:hypothetical protein
MASPNRSAAPSDNLISNRPHAGPHDSSEEAVRTESPFIFPSGVPSLGNCILGPRIPGSLNKASTATANHTRLDILSDGKLMEPLGNDLLPTGPPLPTINTSDNPHDTIPTTRKRKLSEIEAERVIEKSDQYSAVPNDDTSNHTLSDQGSPTDDIEETTKEVDFQLLAEDTKALLAPYIWLHPSCAVARPIQIIHLSLSSPSLTATSLMSLIKDTEELLKVLEKTQLTVYKKFEGTKETLQQAGLESLLEEAWSKVESTKADLQKIRGLIKESQSLIAN